MGGEILYTRTDEILDQGRSQGVKQGREEGVKAIVDIYKSIGGSSVDAAERIVASMDYSRPEADALVEKYW